MDGPKGYYAKWNKSDREKQVLYDLTYMWNPKSKTNQDQNNTDIDSDTENKLLVASGDGHRWISEKGNGK